jgi:hypothetical protein
MPKKDILNVFVYRSSQLSNIDLLYLRRLFIKRTNRCFAFVGLDKKPVKRHYT